MMALDPSRVGFRDNSTKKLMDDCYEYAQTQWQQYWVQANIDRRFAVGDQRFLAGMDGQFYQNQKFCFNLLHAYRQMILGYQRRHRKSSVVVPIQDRYQQLADDYSGSLIWTMKADNMLHKISECFDQALVTGLCLIHHWRDYTHDPIDGMLKIKGYAPTTTIMDPWWRERDLSDCRFVWTRDFLNIKQIKTILPNIVDDISYFPKVYNSSTRFTFMPESYQVRKRKKENYAYDQFYYSDDRAATLLYSFDRDETYEIKDADTEAREMWVQMNFAPEERGNVVEVKTRIPCVRMAIAVNDKTVYDEYYADSYPFTPMMAYFEPDSINYAYRFYGPIRIGRDPQYLYNRRMQIQLDILESLPNTGINVVEDALIDKNDAFKHGPGQVRTIKKGYIPDQVISNMNPPTVDMSAFKMTDDLAALSRSLMGINEELMGMAENSDTGIQEMLRQGASLTTLQTLFDNLDLSQSILSHKLIQDIRENDSPKRIANILGREPSADFYNVSAMKFNCEVEDGLNTSTQKQMQFAQMMQLQQAGLPFSPSTMIKASTLQNKNEYIQDLEQTQQQQQQAEQMKQQSEMMEAQAKVQLLQAQAASAQTMAMRNVSSVTENEQIALERRARALDDIELAQLHKVETLKKLEEIDIGNIERLINILNGMEERSFALTSAHHAEAKKLANNGSTTNPEVSNERPPQ